MKYVCIKCGESFSVTADQFGTRGKCPHCRATILMPRFRENYQRGSSVELAPPSSWMDRSLSALIAIGLHLLIIASAFLIPYRLPSDGLIGLDGPVLIGELPAERIEMEAANIFPDVQLLQPPQNSLHDALNDSLTVAAEVDTNPMLVHSLPSAAFGGAQRDLGLAESPQSAALAAGGQENFTDLIARLKREGLDIAITFDSTGSMGGEIQQVKHQVERIGSVLFKLIPKTRLSICTYRDQGDDYVVTGLTLTDNLGEVVTYLDGISAGGGGDEPEAVVEGLRWSIEQNKFRRQARKIILVFGDAPPHASTQVDCLKLASDFRRTGGIVSTVTCRSSKRLSQFIEIAQLGGGESFLTSNEREIMSQLVVLVFGSAHREKVLEMFQLMNQRRP